MINAVRFYHTPDITVINQKQYEAHYSLYVNYVNSINKLTSELENVCPEVREEANVINGMYRSLKRGETYSLNGVILHELYFRNIGGIQQKPKDHVKKSIEKQFGSMENWEKDFVATAKASRGWAVLIYDQRTKSLRNISMDAHDEGMITLSYPILILDMYEHAYFVQYVTNKEAYIQAFMENIHWDIIAQRMNCWDI